MVQRLVSVGDDFTLPTPVKVANANLPAHVQPAALSATIGTQVSAGVAPKLDKTEAQAEYARFYGNLIVGDGDSITQASVDSIARIFADSWYTYMTIFSDGRLPYVYNAGHGGWTSAQLLAVLDAEAIAKLPSGGQVVWASGRNDSQSIALTRAADLEVVSRLRAAGIKPILTTIPPVGNLALADPAAPAATPLTTGGTLAAATREYKIVAKNANGVTLPSAGTSAVTTGTTGSVVLTWAYQSGTTGYDVYRDGLKIGSVSNHFNCTFTDTGQAASGTVPGANTTGKVGAAADILFTAKVNAWRKRYSAREGITCIDFYDVLADPTTGRFKQGLSFDGVHPSQAAQRLMGQAAWAAVGGIVANSKGYIAEDQADPLNLYTNGLMLTGIGSPQDRPSPFNGATVGTGLYTSTWGPLAGFKGNAWTIDRLTASAPTYLGSADLTTGFSVGDVIQFSCKYQKTGEATGLISEVGLRFVPNAPADHVGLWKIVGDVTEPTRLVSPEVTIPAGVTSLRLVNYIYGGTGKVTLGQMTVVNLTTGQLIA